MSVSVEVNVNNCRIEGASVPLSMRLMVPTHPTFFFKLFGLSFFFFFFLGHWHWHLACSYSVDCMWTWSTTIIAIFIPFFFVEYKRIINNKQHKLSVLFNQRSTSNAFVKHKNVEMQGYPDSEDGGTTQSEHNPFPSEHGSEGTEGGPCIPYTDRRYMSTNSLVLYNINKKGK